MTSLARVTTCVAIMLAVGACNGKAPSKPAATPSRTIVPVTLQEWAISPSRSSIAPGVVGFQPSNRGPKNKHELVIVRTDLAPGSLPTASNGSVNLKAAGITFIGRVGPLDVGSAGSANFTLTAGNYVLFCNLVTKQGSKTNVHYRLGMRIAFKVT